MTKARRLVVVDGSNLATEGRALPSLRQLDEAVRAYLGEHDDQDAIVVVDATFEHRVSTAERAKVKQAELSGELVTPPAGAIGRGDAFILQIARRANAIVLSNDSFQEFHAEHPWLFEEGRLVGGKPVPKVGWVFTARTPVRGVRSKVATAKAARSAKATAAAAAEAEALATEAEAVLAPARAARPAKRGTTARAETSPPAAPKPPRARRATAAKAPAPAPAPAPAEAPAPAARARKRVTRSASTTTEAGAPPAEAQVAAAVTRDESPVNSQRTFRALRSRHDVKAVVDGEVASFTSHGAIITVIVGRGTKVACYVPLSGLGRPAPKRARDVLKLGERRRFRIVSFDEERRIAQLALAAT